MFREMRRSPQALSHEEMIDLLKTETRGVMSVQGDDGYPYGFPINHYFDEDANRIYIHGADFGHRVDAVRKDPKVSYCVFGQDQQKEGDQNEAGDGGHDHDRSGHQRQKPSWLRSYHSQSKNRIL